MFDDAIKKLLWKEKRQLSPSGEAGLRDPSPAKWTGSDPGWIFRTDVETEIRIPRGHIRRLIQGPLPDGLKKILFLVLDHPWLLPLLLVIPAALLAALTRKGYFYYLLLTGVLLLAILALSGLHYLLPAVTWLLPFSLIAGALLWIWNPYRKIKDAKSPENLEAEPRISHALHTVDILIRWTGLTAHALVLIGLFAALWVGREFVDGRVGDLRFGPFPKGMPINALMNMNPEAPLSKQLAAVRGLLSTIGKLRDADRAGKQLTEAERLGIFNREAGPALMRVSKCPDFVLDRGHYFGQDLTDDEKNSLIAFLKTL
jgi:hypothetical protein